MCVFECTFFCNRFWYVLVISSPFAKRTDESELLLEAVDLLEPGDGDAVDGKLICEPQLVGRKEPKVSMCFPSRLFNQSLSLVNCLILYLQFRGIGFVDVQPACFGSFGGILSKYSK